VPIWPFIAVLAIGGGIGFSAWNEAREKEREAEESAKQRKEDEERFAAERKADQEAEERRIGPLKALVTTYAAIDPGTLPDGPIELSRGRRVLGIETVWQVAEPKLRRKLQIPEEGLRRDAFFAPESSAKLEGAPSIALRPEDVGTVVLVASVTGAVGVYKDNRSANADRPNELPAIATVYSFIAFVVPERKVVARWVLRVQPPPSIRVTADGTPLEFTFGQLTSAEYLACTDALFAGRSPRGDEP
jgi:hypothetical protein